MRPEAGNPSVSDSDLLEAYKVFKQIAKSTTPAKATTQSSLVDWFVAQASAANIGHNVATALFEELFAVDAITVSDSGCSIAITQLSESRFEELEREERTAYLDSLPRLKDIIDNR